MQSKRICNKLQLAIEEIMNLKYNDLQYPAKFKVQNMSMKIQLSRIQHTLLYFMIFFQY